MDIYSIGIKADTRDIDRGKKRLDDFATSGARVQKATDGVKNSVNLLKAAMGGLAALGIFREIKGAVGEFEKLQRNLLRTQQIVKSTGSAAGFSVKELHEQARQLSLATLQSTEGIMEAQQIMMTFRKVTGETFTRATEMAADLATVTGTNLNSSMTMLGKALESPTQGLTAMARVGVSFDESQKELIKTLDATGRTAEAQKVILDVLAEQYGGVAKNEAKGLAGSQDTLGQAMQEARQEIGGIILESSGLISIYDSLAKGVFAFTEALKSGDIDVYINILKTIGYTAVTAAIAFGGYALTIKGATVAQAAFNAVAAMNPYIAIATGITIAVAAMYSFRDATFEIGETTVSISSIVESLWQNVFKDIWDNAMKYLGEIPDIFRNLLTNVQETASGFTENFAKAFKFIADMAKAWLNNQIGLFVGLGKTIGFIAYSFTEVFKNSFDSVLEMGNGFWTSLTDVFEGDFSFSAFKQSLTKNLVSPLSDAAGEIGNIFEKSFGKDYVGEITGFMTNAFENVKTSITGWGSALIDNAGELQKNRVEIEKTGDTVDNLVDSLNNVPAIVVKTGETSEKTTKQMISVYEEAAKRIDAVFADAWMNLDEGFNGVADGLRDAFKRMLAEMAHAATTQKIMVNMGVTQAGQAGAASGNPYAAAGAIAILGVSAAINNANAADEKRANAIIEELVSNKNLTGTVLGDINAKSNSIKNSSEMLADLASDSLSVNRGMYQALLNIQAGIVQAVTGIAKSADVQSLGSHNMSGGVPNIDGLVMASFGPMAGIAMIADKIAGGIIGNIAGGISSSLFGKKESIVAAGIYVGETTIGDMEDGIDSAVQAWRSKKVTKTQWGMSSTKFYDEFFDLGDEVASEMSNIFLNMRDVLKMSGNYLAEGAEGFEEILNDLATIPEKINLLNMSAEEQAEVLQNYISMVGDEWTETILDFLNIEEWAGQFQKPGEAMLETMSRVVSQSMEMEHMFGLLGITMEETFNEVINYQIKDLYNVVEIGRDQINTTKQTVAELTQNMAELAGGFDKLSANMMGYYGNFFSAEEQLEKQTELLTSRFDELGYALPATKDAFRDLVDSLDITTESGQEAFVRLMELQGVVADTFDKTAKAAEEAAAAQLKIIEEKNAAELKIIEELARKQNELDNRKYGFETQILELQGNVSELRRRELLLLDESLHSLQLRVWALQDEQIAAAELKKTMEDGLLKSFEGVKNAANHEISALNDLISARQEEIKYIEEAQKALEDNLKSAFDNVVKSIDAEKEKTNEYYQSIFDGLKSGIDSTKQSISELQATSDTLQNAMKSLRVESEEMDRYRLQQARQVLSASAASGIMPGNLSDILEAATGDSEKFFGSFEDYVRDQSKTTRDIESLANITDNQISVEERTLANLENQLKNSEIAKDQTLLSLDNQLETAQKQYNSLMGIEDSVLSVDDSLRLFYGESFNFNEKMQGLIANKILKEGLIDTHKKEIEQMNAQIEIAQNQYNALLNINAGINNLTSALSMSNLNSSVESEIKKLYKEVLGREADKAGLDFWMDDVRKSGTTMDQLREIFRTSEEGQRVGAFAAGGYHSGGLRIVGEDGPEMEMTGPSRIFSNANTKNMLDTTSLENEVRELRNELKISQYQIAKNTGKTAKYVERWDGDGLPEERAVS